MAKDKRTKVEMRFSDKSISIILIIVGILLFGLSFEDIYRVSIIFNIISVHYMCIVFESIGLTLISAGLVSLLLEISSIRSLMESSIDSAFDKVLDANFPLDSYSKERLQYLHNSIACEISNSNLDIKQFNNSVYSMEKRLLDSTNNLYYEYHKTECHINVTDDYFIKTVDNHYKIINTNGFQNIIKVGLNLFDYKDGLTDSERKSSIDITCFKVNDTDLLEKIKDSINVEKLNTSYHVGYDYRITFGYELQKCRSHTVRMTYSYKIPKKDLTHGYKISYPCKKLRHTISIHSDNEQWALRGHGFTAFYCSTFDSEKYNVEQTVDDSISIKYDDWILPGAGYTVVLSCVNK